MKSNLKFFKKKKSLPVDKFFQNVLYDKKNGYYATKEPFGQKGDFITAPKKEPFKKKKTDFAQHKPCLLKPFFN